MKSDSYLNVCIDQARLSPLHYRHGSIVVKGGKVIGQGFNDYRPGYDGGSVLKSGVLPKSASPSVDGTTPDKKSDPLDFNLRAKTSRNNFKPVEAVSGNCSGGQYAHASLSMHSEMMAINSALASSSTLAASTAQHIKPFFKVFGDSKRKRVLRRDALAAYVRAVCLAAARGTPAQQQQQHQQEQQQEVIKQEQNRKQKRNHNHDHQHHYAAKDAEQYQSKNGYKHKQYKSYCRHQRRGMRSKTTSSGGISDKKSYVKSDRAKVPTDTDSSTGAFGQRKVRNGHLLVPKGRTETSTSGTRDRVKHPKLVGADVYVVRLARPFPEPIVRKKSQNGKQRTDEAMGENESHGCSTTSGLSSSTRSLYDELSCKAKGPTPPVAKLEDIDITRLVAASRPCYRCVSYMHSVGIKRVFWTTSEGKWEGAKVRDLVDLLGGATMSSDNPLNFTVFITKHEVLLLRRLMAGGEG